MPLFVHEFCDYPNLKNEDNGWWEYDPDTGKVYNRRGGWHMYHEHPLQEFKEATWDEIIALTIRDDSYATGWIAPSGEWFGCAPEDHVNFAIYYLNTTEEQLEQDGWIKVTEIPIWLYRNDRDLWRGRYEYHFLNPYKYITKAQEKTLAEHGLELTEYDREYNLQ